MSTALGKRAMITMVRSRMNSRAPVSLVTTTATNESSPEPPNSSPEPPPLRLCRMNRSSSHPDRDSPAVCRSDRPAQAARTESDRGGVLPDRSSNSFLTMLRYSELPCSMLTLISSSASFRLLSVRASCSWVVRLDFS